MNASNMLGWKAHKVRKRSLVIIAVLAISLFLAMNTGLRFAAETTNCVADHAMAKGAVCSSSYDQYNVTIVALGFRGSYDYVAITMDSSPTGFSTPHTFTGLTGVHSFTVPYNDPKGNPFETWENDYFTSIMVDGPGTYYCWYDVGYHNVQVRDPYPAEYRYFITPYDQAVVATADNMMWGQIIDYVASHVSYNYNEGNTWEFPNETLKSGLGQCRDFATLCASMLIARGYDAYVVSGNLTGPGGTQTEHAWVALELGGRIYSIEPQRPWIDQPDFSAYNAFEYVNTSGIYPPSQIAPTTPPAPPGPDLIYIINYYIRMITVPVYTWIENATGNGLPPSISAALNYLLIEQPIVLCILLLALLVLVGIVVHFIRKWRKGKEHVKAIGPQTTTSEGTKQKEGTATQVPIPPAMGTPRTFRFCPSCGQSLPAPQPKFCPFCGFSLGN
jgi:hypothetical protein